jgi:hypothetical protein
MTEDIKPKNSDKEIILTKASSNSKLNKRRQSHTNAINKFIFDVQNPI